MDFIFVDDNRLKVILSAQDMQMLLERENNPTQDEFEKNAFRYILKKAKSVAGLDFENARLLVRCFQSKDGGCELFITKDTGYRMLKRRKQRQQYYYKTSELNSLSDACKYVVSTRFPFTSCVFHDETIGYCLVLSLPLLPSYSSVYNENKVFSRLKEYGGFHQLSAEQRMYIAEHCKQICEKNAVKVFSKFSN